MSLLVIPNTFVNGTTINAAPFNSNFSAVATAVNNIDNTNIGAAGLYASQLAPTTIVQATFGGSVGYTFPSSVLVPSGSVSAGTLATGATTGDLSAARSATTGAVFWGSNGSQYLDFGLTTAGRFTLNGAGLTVTTNGIASGALPAPLLTGDLSASRSATTGALYMGSNGSNYFDFGISSAGSFSFTGGGIRSASTVVGTQSGSTTQTYLPPVYTTAGAAVAGTLHAVIGTVTITTTGSTAGNNYAALSSGTVTLSGAAAFSSATSYAVAFFSPSGGLSGGTTTITAQQISGTQFEPLVFNGGLSALGTGSTGTASFLCLGT
jgi:hypothetical protein